jgi:hypothetical protein
MVPMAAEYGADFVALMWGPEGLPRDENERAALCVELLYFANEAGIPNEKIWVDGIVTPVNIQQPQAISLMEFQKMLQDIAPGAKSTCGLSNISNGPPDHLRPILNQTYMVMLMKCGMQSSLPIRADEQLTAIAKGERQDIVDLIYGMLDGVEPDRGQPVQGNAGLRQDRGRHPRQNPVLGLLAGNLEDSKTAHKKTPSKSEGVFFHSRSSMTGHARLHRMVGERPRAVRKELGAGRAVFVALLDMRMGGRTAFDEVDKPRGGKPATAAFATL